MSDLSDRVKTQMNQINESFDQFIHASRGLYVKIREEGNKQFEDLMKTGEKQLNAEEPFIKQLQQDLLTPFEDMKGTLDQLKHASVGLVVKARNRGESYFDELVTLGSAKAGEVADTAKVAANKTRKRATAAKQQAKAATSE